MSATETAESALTRSCIHHPEKRPCLSGAKRPSNQRSASSFPVAPAAASSRTRIAPGWHSICGQATDGIGPVTPLSPPPPPPPVTVINVRALCSAEPGGMGLPLQSVSAHHQSPPQSPPEHAKRACTRVRRDQSAFCDCCFRKTN